MNASNPEAVTLSVIMPTYNRAAYVRQCLRSLRACGLADLEIIVADDGSTDDTARVVADTDPAARYFRQENSGTPATPRNRGFEMCRGRYVAFLDCDDQWFPGVAPRMLDLMERNPEVDVTFTDARVGNPENGFASLAEVNKLRALDTTPHRQPAAGFRVYERTPFFRAMVQKNLVFLGSAIMRREAFARVGGFDPDMRGAADWELCQRLARVANFAFWSEPLALYYLHPGCMSGNAEHMEQEFCRALQKVRQKCPSLEPPERRLVDEQLRRHMFEVAYRAYDRGEFRGARALFRELFRECGPEFRGAAYWSLCALPFGLAGNLRRLKRALSRRPAAKEAP